MDGQMHGSNGNMDRNSLAPYFRLFVALGLSLLVMFPLSMAFVNTWSDFYLNLSNFYMAVSMVAPMGFIMVLVMWKMYPNRTLNVGLLGGFVVLFFIGIWLGRAEIGVGNDQFLRAMIPHHSRAILVCQNASITDQEIEQLCSKIVKSQQEEIDQMKQILDDR